MRSHDQSIAGLEAIARLIEVKALILERGASGLFCDYRELLKKLQQSYSQRGDGSEADILAPILSAQVLVLMR